MPITPNHQPAMNEKPCTVCGVPESDHTKDWRAHNYVPPVDDTQREQISAEGFRDVLSGGGTVSEIAARESGGAQSVGSGGPSVLDRLNGIVDRFGLMVQAFGELLNQKAPATDTPDTPNVPDIPTTSVHAEPENHSNTTEEPPSNPE